MKEKKAGRVLLSFLLTLAMVIGLMPGMSMTAYAESEPTVTISPEGGGTVSIETSGSGLGAQYTFTATPAGGYRFVKWTFKDYNGSTASVTDNPWGCQVAAFTGGSYSNLTAFFESTTTPVSGISLDQSAVSLSVGGTETLTATVSPEDASNKSVTWSSSDTTVATVENGVVTAVGSGTANITVTATNGTDDASDDMTATCAVTVNAATVRSSVTLNANGGTINSGNITEYTEGIGATLPTDVTKDGHQFGGWYDNDGLTGSPVTAISTSDTGNKQYWAKWTANPSSVSYSVVFKVVNGSWDDGNTSDKSVTLSGMEGDTLRLSSGQIPAVGTKPNDGYKAGSWDVTPSTDTVISSNKTYTYTYVADSSGGSSDSGSGDSSGGSSDSGSGSSSSGSTDSGSGSSSSSGSSDSGNTSGGTSSGSSDNTNTNTDTSAKVPYDDVAISTGSVNDITGTASATAESNPFGTKIENSSNLTTLLSLTDAEVAQGVNVWLDI